MKQIVIIHGGDSYSSESAWKSALENLSIDYDRLKPTRSWKNWLAEQLSDFDVLTPNFPNKQNAKYDEWEIYFKKIIPLLGDDVQLVGHSLGAMFLTKFLNKHILEQPVKRLVLMAGAYDDDSVEDLGSFKIESAKNLVRSAQEIHLLHSEDDPIVPFSELAKYQADLPNAVVEHFTNRNHFLDETQPELLEILKK